MSLTPPKTVFTIDFGSITKGHAIEYDTVPRGLIAEERIYSNSAAMKADYLGVDYSKEWPAKVTVKKHDSFVEKSGAQSGNVVLWEIVINPNQSEIITATLQDRLSLRQAYKRESFVLYAASYDASGNNLVKGAVVSPLEYTL